jgi:hypothetical protein
MNFPPPLEPAWVWRGYDDYGSATSREKKKKCVNEPGFYKSVW